MASGISFYPPLPAGLDASHVTIAVQTTTPACPGAGMAAPGNLCVYIDTTQDLGAVQARTHDNGLGADPWGANLYATAAFSGTVQAVGSWTVTAP